MRKRRFDKRACHYDRRDLAGDESTITDRIDYPWTVGRKGQGQDVEEFQYFERWFAEIGDRAARHGGGQRAVDGRIEALAQGIVSDGNGPAEFDTSAECR